MAHGISDVEKRVHMLTGIYYGTMWSLDFKVEHSKGRNILFEQFLGRSFEGSDDPRPLIGVGLFNKLQRAQDAGGVDMGHLLIGLDARMRSASRDRNVPGTQASGLELVTWAGDLGGGAARLAFDEGQGRGSVARYFSGTDFGANSNLEGDIAAYVVGSLGEKTLKAPHFPKGSIAGGFEEYFIASTNKEWTNQKARFQEIIAGTAHTSTAKFSVKIESFARLYYGSRVVADNISHPGQVAAGVPHLGDATTHVAGRFLTWLSAGSSSAHRH